MRRSKMWGLTALIAIAALAAGIWMGHSYADSNSPAPGSEADPLITKSYVDQALAELKDSLSGEGPGAIALEVVTVPAGQRLIGYAGTELILRAGQARAVAPSVDNGLPDLTAGTNLPPDATIPANHLLLLPRDDGRGLQAITDLIVMVRGRWTIEP
ncbi:MAG: hypothetical protein ACOX18_08175 [Bacillota bacterium]|jgi:hypothetical protein